MIKLGSQREMLRCNNKSYCVCLVPRAAPYLFGSCLDNLSDCHLHNSLRLVSCNRLLTKGHSAGTLVELGQVVHAKTPAEKERQHREAGMGSPSEQQQPVQPAQAKLPSTKAQAHFGPSLPKRPSSFARSGLQHSRFASQGTAAQLSGGAGQVGIV